MVALSSRDRERVFFHLGYGARANIDIGDIARVEQSCKEIPSDYMKATIKKILDLCDTAWDNWNLSSNEYPSVKETYIGDINRTVIRTESREQQRIWYAEYLRLTDQLAQQLACANYTQPGMERYKHAAQALGAYVKTVPGPADTSTASRWVARSLFKGFGYRFGYLYN